MRFVSRPVITGLVNALAILIFMAQLPELTHVSWHVYAIPRAVQAGGIDLPVTGASSDSPLRSLIRGSKTSELPRSFSIPTVPMRQEACMTLLHTLTHPGARPGGTLFERQAVRAVIMRASAILLLYTRRYDDYSFPGGGLSPGEDPVSGLRRELIEETGAANVSIEGYLGYLDEYRPPLKGGDDTLFMRSHFYLCCVEGELGEASPEAYELANGMVPRWIGIDAAIEHNRQVLGARPASMGSSIERETWMLAYVADQVALQGR